ncbi:hypothetical protein SP99_02012 [Enterobacter sp. BIDMC92]|uniref:hypothetical protein n=1 Tax=Enterobacter sp. BIDMC92 TaxID=1594172 RepID=UPI00064D6021|nr:hypothetical protein [Enterobacter sp. BIDMC92]KLW91792.1 hypothetical protein SP99_02012 [Enterobacter sp. BIDMC92]
MKHLLIGLALLASFSACADEITYQCEGGYQFKYDLVNVQANKGYVAVLQNGKQKGAVTDVQLNDVWATVVTPDGDSVDNIRLDAEVVNHFAQVTYYLTTSSKGNAPFVGGFMPVYGHEFEDKGGKATLIVSRNGVGDSAYQCTRKPFRG